MIKYDSTTLKKILDAKEIRADKAAVKYKQYKATIMKLDSLSDYSGDEYIKQMYIEEINGKLIPVWFVGSEDDRRWYIFLDKDKKNVATIDDIVKIKPLNARSLNHSDKWKIASVHAEQIRASTADAAKENLPIINVFHDVFNAHKKNKQSDLVPFDFLAETVQRWVTKAAKDKNVEALGNALEAIYDAYNIDSFDYVGQWKQFQSK